MFENYSDLVFINSTHPNQVSFYLNQFIYLFHIDTATVDYRVKGIILNTANEMRIVKLPITNWLKLRDSVINEVADLAIRKLISKKGEY